MHHAILFLGERAEVDKKIDSLGLKLLGNPDVFIVDKESIGIDDARLLSERALEKAFGDEKFFILKIQRITNEAQNALLKTLEDPTPGTHFVLSAKEAGIFLPTLLSRLQIERVGGELEDSEAKKFLKKGIKQRLDYAKKFSASLPDFLDSLLLELRKKGVSLKQLDEVMGFRNYARDNSVQARLILEHLALVI